MKITTREEADTRITFLASEKRISLAVQSLGKMFDYFKSRSLKYLMFQVTCNYGERDR